MQTNIETSRAYGIRERTTATRETEDAIRSNLERIYTKTREELTAEERATKGFIEAMGGSLWELSTC